MDAAAPAETPPRRPPPRRGRALRIVAVIVGVLVALALLVAGAAWWALSTPGGTRWALARVPGLEVTAPRGSLLGDFAAESLVLTLGETRVAITDLQWRGLAVSRSSADGPWLRVSMDRLQAARADVKLAPSDPNAPSTGAPQNLNLPVELKIDELRLGELHLAALGDQPVKGLSASVHLHAGDGGTHRLERFALARGDLRASGRLQIGARGDMALDGELRVAQAAAGALPAWQADARIAGPLARPRLQASAQAQPTDAAVAPASLTAEATLQPFADFPLAALQAATRDLDLAAFVPGAPTTSLTGDVQAQATGADQPADVRVTLNNAAAGRWDASRVPLRALDLRLQARPADPGTLEITALEAALGSAEQPAGRLTGTGRWAEAGWTFAATLADVAPARLDARAPAMTLGGRIALDGRGFTGPGPERRVSGTVDLQGQLADGPRRPLALQAQAEWVGQADSGAQQITIQQAQARQGDSRARVSGTLRRDGTTAPWQVVAQTELADFDPAAWWPGPEGTAWRRGPHRLNASADVDLVLPTSDPAAALERWLAELNGRADVRIGPSQLAGVPLSGSAQLTATADAPADVALRVDVAGNTAEARGRLARAPKQPADRWSGQVAMPALQRLEPLLQLFDTARPRPGATLAGSVRGRFEVDGRWPSLATRGDLRAEGLRVAGAAARRADAAWRLGTAPGGPMEVDVEVAGVQLPAEAGAPDVPALTLRTRGSANAHELQLQAEVAALPPAWTDLLQPRESAAIDRTRAELRARGGFLRRGGAADVFGVRGWKGTLETVRVRTTTASAAPLLQAEGVPVEVAWAGDPLRLNVGAGRAEVLGSRLQWDRVAYQGAVGNAPARVDARARLEPVAIAPILDRLQPDFGWQGDLRLGASVVVQSAPTLRADVVVERASGDLVIATETQTQPLGLSDLRIGLDARNGVWNFTLALAGKLLGVGSGAVVARTSPTALWPTPDASLQGGFELQLADLSAFSAWVPVGWRIGGGLQASASVGGRFGAPEFTGRLRGNGLTASNFLEGVRITDGTLAASLDGTTGRIERFVARAGQGTIRIEGGAEFGATPTARLTLQADKAEVLARVDRRVAASGRAQMRLDKDTIAVNGAFRVDEGLIDVSAADAPALSDDVVVIRDEPPPRVKTAARDRARADEPPPTVDTTRAIAMDVRVDLGDSLKVRGMGINTALAGNLRITAPGGELRVNGEVRTVGGIYAAYGQKMKIERGIIDFNGPVQNPRLDIRATRADLEIKVGVAITGTAQLPRVRLFSIPDMSELDKLSWLTTGKPSSSLAGNESALLQRAALALFAGNEGSGENGIAQKLGLTDISLSRGESGSGLADTVVSLGKQISDRWYLGYAQSLNATGGSWEVIYRVAERFRLRAQTGTASALDMIFTWRWD